MGLPQDSRTNTLTASADVPESVLGVYDLHQLRTIRNMAERHVQRAVTKAATLTAAADPTELIDQSMIDEFVDAAIVMWDDARNLIYTVVGDLPTPLFEGTVTSGIRDATRAYRDMLSTVLSKNLYGRREPIFGEFMKGSLVQYGDVRPLLVTLGGGSVDPVVPLMGGVATGETMQQWLSNNGIESNQKIWLYGYEDEPRRTFNGHLQMDGLVFSAWDDDGLRIAPQDAWLRRTHYQPGDHWGCACVVAPYIPNFGEPYELELPSV